MTEKRDFVINEVEEINNTDDNNKICYITCDPSDRKSKEYLTIISLLNERGYNVYRTSVYDNKQELSSYEEKAKPILNPIEICCFRERLLGGTLKLEHKSPKHENEDGLATFPKHFKERLRSRRLI